MPSSDSALRAAKAKTKAYKLYDSEALYAAVSPNGSKLCRFKYRFRSLDKLLSLGPYPAIGVKYARPRRDVAKKRLANHIAPLSAL